MYITKKMFSIQIFHFLQQNNNYQKITYCHYLHVLQEKPEHTSLRVIIEMCA